MISYVISKKYSKSVTSLSYLRELKGGNSLNLELRECVFIATRDQTYDLFPS